MPTNRAWILALASLLSLFSFIRADEPSDTDDKILRDAHVAADGPALLQFLRDRTLTDADRQKAEDWIRQLGSESFEQREAASRALIARGSPLLPLLRKATQDADAEIARRAEECIHEIEKGPGPELAAAVVRVLVRRAPDGVVAALLNYLPYTDDATVEEEVLTALVALAARAPKIEPALTTALRDPLPLRRAAAAYVLGRRSEPEERERVAALLKDANYQVRLRAAEGLLHGKDRVAVPALVALLEDGPIELAWQAEEMLQRLAGEQSPNAAPADETAAARKQWREAWAAWWQRHGAAVDLERFEKEPRSLGLTLAIEWNTNRVWECGPDGKVRWELHVDGPMDAQVLPGNRVLIAEANSHRITERDLKGNIVWEYKVAAEPINCERLPNGNTFIGTRNGVLEVNRAGQIVVEHKFGDGLYVHGMGRTRGGHYVYIANDGAIAEFDASGKEIRKFNLPNEGRWGEVEALPGGRYLVANYGTGKVLEVDGAGKILWQKDVADAGGIQRLHNGQILVAAGPRVVVIDQTGKTVWETQTNGHTRRAHRR